MPDRRAWLAAEDILEYFFDLGGEALFLALDIETLEMRVALAKIIDTHYGPI